MKDWRDISIYKKVIDAYREDHVVDPVKDWADDVRLGYVMRCGHDLIRVHQERDGGFRHDLLEIRQAELMGTVLPLSMQEWAIGEDRELVVELDEQRRHLDEDVERANEWTAEELLIIASQTPGMSVRRA